MEIYNGGVDYEIGDTIDFVNVPGCLGTGAAAQVSNVSANGAITEVVFTEVPGHHIGGSGYNILSGVYINSANGHGANVMVTATLGSGAQLRSDQSSIGAITRIVVTSRGRNYDQNTYIDLTQSGDGSANASVSVLEGIITYPGRWLNDDGQLDSFNFLQDRDFYQSFSYVVRSRVPIAKFRSVLKNLTHPAGTKLFGEFLYDEIVANTYADVAAAPVNTTLWYSREYDKTNTQINIAWPDHSILVNTRLGIEFTSGNTANLGDANANGFYIVSSVGDDHIIVLSTYTGNTNGNADIVIIG